MAIESDADERTTTGHEPSSLLTTTKRFAGPHRQRLEYSVA